MVAQPTKFAWNKGKYLVYFTSPHCGYCQSFSSTWDKAVEELKESAPHINALKVNAEEFDIASVSPEVYGYPTVRAYSDGKMVDDFDEDRTTTNLMNFANTHLSEEATQTGGGRHRRRTRVRQRGGMAPVSFVGAPVDAPSTVPPAQQSSGPMASMPPPAPHGGLYGPSAPPAQGGWGSIPVTPTAVGYSDNLRSANPPPGATEQYMTGASNRRGNSYSAKTGVHHYKDGTTYALQCTNDARGGNRRRSRRSRSNTRRNSRRNTRRSRRRGGLNLRSANMDSGAPFHPEWHAMVAPAKGGRKQRRTKRRRGRGGRRGSVRVLRGGDAR